MSIQTTKVWIFFVKIDLKKKIKENVSVFLCFIIIAVLDLVTYRRKFCSFKLYLSLFLQITPLMEASSNGHSEVVRYLLDGKADVALKNLNEVKSIKFCRVFFTVSYRTVHIFIFETNWLSLRTKSAIKEVNTLTQQVI